MFVSHTKALSLPSGVMTRTSLIPAIASLHAESLIVGILRSPSGMSAV